MLPCFFFFFFFLNALVSMHESKSSTKTRPKASPIASFTRAGMSSASNQPGTACAHAQNSHAARVLSCAEAL